MIESMRKKLSCQRSSTDTAPTLKHLSNGT
jgi:hypothetical protein